MKFCSKCGTTKALAEFSTRKNGRPQSYCRACVKVASVKWRADNTAKSRASTVRWQAANADKALADRATWAAANPEKLKVYAATYRAKNSEKRMGYNAAWRAANSDKAKSTKNQWRAANPEKDAFYNHNRRARKLGNGGTLSNGLPERLFKLQRGRCACGCQQPLGDKYHMDHWMPLALGGANADGNMRLLTPTCNLSKGAKHPVDFMQQRGFLL